MAEQEPHPVNRALFQPSALAAPKPGQPSAPAAPVLGLCLNQPNGGPFNPSMPETLAPRTRAMADAAKKWTVGKTLNVSFLNGDDAWGQEIRQAVRTLAPIWSDYANLKFVFDQPTAHIAVNL